MDGDHSLGPVCELFPVDCGCLSNCIYHDRKPRITVAATDRVLRVLLSFFNRYE